MLEFQNTPTNVINPKIFENTIDIRRLYLNEKLI